MVAASAAAAVGCRASEVFLASTGVIGEPLPAGRITAHPGELAEAGAAGGWHEAAEAIMTTDTYPKLATASARIDGHKVTINGIAKGSGMIAPDMATMLAFVFTDAHLPAGVLQELLSAGVKTTFNAITVDSDTSTSDTLLLFATGKGAAHPAIAKANDKRLADFRTEAGCGAARSRAAGRARRRGCAETDPDRRDGRAKTMSPPIASAWRSPIRRW